MNKTIINLSLLFLTIMLTSDSIYSQSPFGINPYQYQNSEPSEKGSPYFIIEGNPEEFDMPLLSNKANASILGSFAEVELVQTYSNNSEKPIEATYVFPMSTKAAVHAMTMQIGDRTIKAEIKEKEEAIKVYDKALSEGKTASLLLQNNPNMFKMKVGNILQNDTIVVKLYYTEVIFPENNIYSFVLPTLVAPRYSSEIEDKPLKRKIDTDNNNEQRYSKSQKSNYDYSISVNLNGNLEKNAISSSTHELDIKKSETGYSIEVADEPKETGNRDFILNYKLTGDNIQSGLFLSEYENEDYFMLMLQPPRITKPNEIIPREYVFIVDVSGSMMGFPTITSKKLMVKLLSSLNKGDKFNLILFAGSNSVLFEESQEASTEKIREAINLIDSYQSGGGTEILPALKRIYDIHRTKGMSRTVVVLTDGLVQVEREAFELVRNNLDEANFFTFGIGTSINRYILEGMARAGMGKSFIVTKPEEAEDAAMDFYNYIKSPIMTDIEVENISVSTYDLIPSKIPDLFSQKPIILMGKYQGSNSSRFRVKGTVAGKEYFVDVPFISFGVNDKDGLIPRIWAREKLAYISDFVAKTTLENNKDDIVKLGLKHSLMTEFTSFVAVDSEVRTSDSAQKVNQTLPMPEQGFENYNSYGSKVQMQSVAGGSGMVSALSPRQVSSKSASSEEYGSFNDNIDYEESDYLSIEDDDNIKGDFDISKIATLAKYPELAKNLGIEGKVIFDVYINSQGKVANIELQNEANQMLVEAAKKAIYDFKDYPIKLKDNNPQKYKLSIPFTFKLDKATTKTKFKEIEIDGQKFSYSVLGRNESIEFGDELSSSYRILNSDLKEIHKGNVEFMLGINEIQKFVDSIILQSGITGKYRIVFSGKQVNRNLKLSFNYDWKEYYIIELEI